MRRPLLIAAVAVLAGSAALAHGSTPGIEVARAMASPRDHDSSRISPSAVSAPEFHAAGAVAALTLLLGGVAVLKGWRRE